MVDCYLGEIRLWPISRIPTGWAACNGQTLAINQYQALFALIGTTYGGNGVSTFNLPDLRSRLPVGAGQGPGLSTYPVGAVWGQENVTLNATQTPIHNHSFNAATGPAASLGPTPSGTTTVANVGANNFLYENGAQAGDTASLLNPGALSLSGQGQPHENRMPVMAMNYIIALQGIFPSQN